jgi:hypothetical protein
VDCHVTVFPYHDDARLRNPSGNIDLRLHNILLEITDETILEVGMKFNKNPHPLAMPKRYFPHCLACALLPSIYSLPFNTRTCSELQTARIGLTADLSTVGGLAAGTLQLTGWVPKSARMRDSEKALSAVINSILEYRNLINTILLKVHVFQHTNAPFILYVFRNKIDPAREH